jgi:tryptophan synthase alpha chain
MSRISGAFERLHKSGIKGFIPFVTAGDPDLATSLSIILKLAELGADVIELGVPFSDPMADGPIIQRSSQRALANGTSLKNVLDLASDVRAHSDAALVLFSYFNPTLRFGIDEFCSAAARAGIDGILLTDVVDVEAAELSGQFARSGIDLISLVAPTTNDERLEMICRQARGFIYAVSRAGVTGPHQKPGSEAELLVRRTRAFTNLPVAVGFGISTRQQIADVWQYADAAVVGSAIVAEIDRSAAPGDPVAAVEQFVGQLVPERIPNETGKKATLN